MKIKEYASSSHLIFILLNAPKNNVLIKKSLRDTIEGSSGNCPLGPPPPPPSAN